MECNAKQWVHIEVVMCIKGVMLVVMVAAGYCAHVGVKLVALDMDVLELV